MHPTAIPRPLTVLALFVAMALAITLTPAIGTAQTDDPTPPPEAVVLARSDEPSDALGAGPVAGILGAPVLLTPTAFLLDTTAEALQTIDPDLVILAGGEVALSADVEAAVTELGYETRRAAGSDRHETAALIAGLLAEFSTGRPLLSGAPITDETIPGLNAERLDGMTLADILAATESGPDEIVLHHAASGMHSTSRPPGDLVSPGGQSTALEPGANAGLPLTGPETVDGTAYGLSRIEFCIRVSGDRRIGPVQILHPGGQVGIDPIAKSASGCYVLEADGLDPNDPPIAYTVQMFAGGDEPGIAEVDAIRSTWRPLDNL